MTKTRMDKWAARDVSTYFSRCEVYRMIRCPHCFWTSRVRRQGSNALGATAKLRAQLMHHVNHAHELEVSK